MAAKKSKKTPVKRVRRTGSVRRTASRASGMLKGKFKWGEALLAALVGYEGDKIIQPLTSVIYDMAPSTGPAASVINAISQGNPNFSTGVNKAMGTVAIAKVAYDAVKKRSLDQNDLSLYIPYALGTVFDGPGGSTVSSEVW